MLCIDDFRDFSRRHLGKLMKIVSQRIYIEWSLGNFLMRNNCRWFDLQPDLSTKSLKFNPILS